MLREGAGMTWTDDDSADVRAAVAQLRAVADRLEADARSRRPGGRTRAALDSAIGALLALDDVYFEREDGSRDADVWKRAKLVMRAGN